MIPGHLGVHSSIARSPIQDQHVSMISTRQTIRPSGERGGGRRIRVKCILLTAAVFVLYLSTSGCDDNKVPSRPAIANVVFTGTVVDSFNGTRYNALAVQNQGTATAYAVRVYWTAGSDTFTYTRPIDLRPHETGLAPTLLFGTIAWLVPSAPDSIRWSASPAP